MKHHNQGSRFCPSKFNHGCRTKIRKERKKKDNKVLFQICSNHSDCSRGSSRGGGGIVVVVVVTKIRR